MERDVGLHSLGAAMLLDCSALVVADLHLGCEAALEYEGLSLPRLQTRRLKGAIMTLIEQLQPDLLVVAGDLKHNFSRNLTQEWNDVASFIRSISELVDISVVRGNHDNYLGAILSEIGIPYSRELRVGRFRVIHGHSGTAQGPTIMGHIHPSVSLADGAGGRVKRSCFLHDGGSSTLVLPALSLISPGLDVTSSPSHSALPPPLRESGLDEFSPISFVDDRPLVFPKLRNMSFASR